MIHLIGIGGAGMSPLAELLVKSGQNVSGCDREKNSKTERLEKIGINIRKGHNINHLKNVQRVIYSRAITDEESELVLAREMNLKVQSRGEALAEELADYNVIGIAGTHGKTTTTAMIIHMMNEMKIPIVGIVGSESIGFESGLFWSRSNDVVVELDESDKMFLLFKPKIGVVTSIDIDHIGKYYNAPEDILFSFKQFLQSSERGLLMTTDKMSKKLSGEVTGNIFTCGLSDDENVKFSIEDDILYFEGYKIKMKVPGEHNLLNAACSLSVMKMLGIDIKLSIETLENFKGVSRRLEEIWRSNKLILISDYAHHPTEVHYTIQGLCRKFKKVLVIFQPHLFSRTEKFYKDFARELSKADRSVLLPIYPAREEPIEGVTSHLIEHEMIKNESEVECLENFEELFHYLRKLVWEGAIVLMGAGDLDLKRDRIVKILKENSIELKK